MTANPPRHVTAVEIAGPGFVNFRLADTWLHDVLRDVVTAGVKGYARPDLGRNRRTNVEFVSANPTGPLHAGHGRGAVYGDSVARLLERCNYDVTREFYLNDRGVQMKAFGASLAARRDGTELPADGYAGQYIADWASELPPGVDPLEWGYERALADQRQVLGALRVHFDVWSSERQLVNSGAVERTLAELRARDMVYDLDGAVWLRSTTFGDDKDRVLVKSDGQFTYLLPDVAYHRDKYARDYELLLDVWGADHHGYIPRMRAALQALGYDVGAFDVAITQLVKLMRGGEEVRLSKRTGDIIALEHKAKVAPAQTCPLVARQCFHMRTLEHILARCWRVKTTQNVHSGGFARTAGAHDRHELTGLDVQVDPLERHQLRYARAIAFGHAPQLDQRVCHLAVAVFWAVMTCMPACSSPAVISVMCPSLMPGCHPPAAPAHRPAGPKPAWRWQCWSLQPQNVGSFRLACAASGSTARRLWQAPCLPPPLA